MAALDPAGRIDHLSERVVVVTQTPVEEVVVRIADVAAKPAFTGKFVLYRRSVIRDHPAERGGNTSIAYDTPQEGDVGTDGFESRGWVEQHESIFELDIDALERIDCGNVLLDGDLLVQRA